MPLGHGNSIMASAGRSRRRYGMGSFSFVDQQTPRAENERNKRGTGMYGGGGVAMAHARPNAHSIQAGRQVGLMHG